MLNHITKTTSHFDIDINTMSNNILIIQRWKYNWLSNGFSEWTYEEKKKMHEAFEKEMARVWNNRASLKVTGRSDFAKKRASSSLSLSFDIQWRTSTGHWTVEVKKVATKDYSNEPNVNWNAKKITLYTVDIKSLHKVGAPKGVNQVNIPHEFGHSIGNSSGIPNMHADEYKTGSPFYNDKNSLMNVGMGLRKRHFDYIIREINTMIQNTQFIITI